MLSPIKEKFCNATKRRFTVMIIPNDKGAPSSYWITQASLYLFAAIVISIILSLLLWASYNHFQLRSSRSLIHLQQIRIAGLELKSNQLNEMVDAKEKSIVEMVANVYKLEQQVRQLEQETRYLYEMLEIKKDDLPDNPNYTPMGINPSPDAWTSWPLFGAGGIIEGDNRIDSFQLATTSINVLSNRLVERRETLASINNNVLKYLDIAANIPQIWPVEGRVTSGFGYRIHPISGERNMHTGIDIAAPHGTPIYAPSKGKVVFSGGYGGYGKTVILDHGYGLETLYAHMSAIKVNRGDIVDQGDVIGQIGTTGVSTGPHLHYEVILDAEPIDPLKYLPN